MERFLNKNRIAVLNDRLDKLIYLNNRFRYTTMVSKTISNPRSQQYTRVLLAIHREVTLARVFNRQNNKAYAESLHNAKNAVCSLTKDILYNITKPTL